MSKVDKELIKVVEEKADIVIDMPTAKQVSKYVNTRDRISYIAKNDDKYRSGGFVISVKNDGEYISLSGGNLKWTIKTSNIKKLFVVSKE
jgi:hypothetical protein